MKDGRMGGGRSDGGILHSFFEEMTLSVLVINSERKSSGGLHELIIFCQHRIYRHTVCLPSQLFLLSLPEHVQYQP